MPPAPTIGTGSLSLGVRAERMPPIITFSEAPGSPHTARGAFPEGAVASSASYYKETL